MASTLSQLPAPAAPGPKPQPYPLPPVTPAPPQPTFASLPPQNSYGNSLEEKIQATEQALEDERVDFEAREAEQIKELEDLCASRCPRAHTRRVQWALCPAEARLPSPNTRSHLILALCVCASTLSRMRDVPSCSLSRLQLSSPLTPELCTLTYVTLASLSRHSKEMKKTRKVRCSGTICPCW